MKFKKKTIFLTTAVAVALVGGTVAIVNNNAIDTTLIEEQLKEKDIKTYYSFSGDIKAKNSKETVLSSATTIDEILVKEGDTVKKGDTLFKTSSGSKITSDMDGMVTDILVSEGVKYESGVHIATVSKMDSLQVEIKVDEYDVNDIKIGDEVEVYINSLDKTVDGKIINLSKNATVTNGISYFRGVVELENTEDVLVGMSVEVKAIKDDVKNVKTISINALEFDDENQPYVYIKDSKGNKIEKSVTVGVNDGSVVEIKSGLKDTDVVVSSSASDMFNPFEMMKNGGK